MKKETAETTKDYVITNEYVAEYVKNIRLSQCAKDAIINKALDENKQFVNFIDHPVDEVEDIFAEHVISTEYFKKAKLGESNYVVIECIKYLNSNLSEEELEEFITKELIPYDEMVSISLEDPWLTKDKQYIGYDSNKKHILFFKGEDWGQVLTDYPNADYVHLSHAMHDQFADMVEFIEAVNED